MFFRRVLPLITTVTFKFRAAQSRLLPPSFNIVRLRGILNEAGRSIFAFFLVFVHLLLFRQKLRVLTQVARFFVRVEARIERDALDKAVVLAEPSHVPCVRRRFLHWEAISVEQQLQRIASRFARLCIVLEELEQVRVLEVLFKVLLPRTRAVDRCQVHAFLVNLAAVNFLLDSAHGHKPINDHVSLLADSKNSIDGLVVVRRVPVRVKNDGSVCASQVQSETTDLRREKSAEDGSIVVEVNTHLLALGDLCVAIDSHVLELATAVEARLDNGFNHGEHLFAHAEDQGSFALSSEAVEQFEEKLQLGGKLDDLREVVLPFRAFYLFQFFCQVELVEQTIFLSLFLIGATLAADLFLRTSAFFSSLTASLIQLTDLLIRLSCLKFCLSCALELLTFTLLHLALLLQSAARAHRNFDNLGFF